MQKTKTKRRTRPEPERTEPNRAFRTAPNGAPRTNGAAPASKRAAPPPNGAAASAKRAAASPNGAAASPNGAATSSKRATPPPNGAASPPNGAGPPPNGESTRSSAYRAVNDAYRLVDEYLRQGQEMAENVWLPFSGNGMPGWPSPGAPERFMRSLGDMTLAWVEVVQQWTSAQQPTAQRPPSGSAGPFDTGNAAEHQAPAASPSSAVKPPEPSARRELGVSIEAKGHVEVSVELAENAASGELEAGWLQPAQGKAAPITDVSLRVDGEKLVVRIVVPEKQPRGTYNGLLLDSQSLKARGTVSVVVR